MAKDKSSDAPAKVAGNLHDSIKGQLQSEIDQINAALDLIRAMAEMAPAMLAAQPGPNIPQPPAIPLIFERMAKVLGEVDAVAKSRENKEQKYMYRSAEDVASAMSPAFAAHLVFPIIVDCEDLTFLEGQYKSGGKYTEVRMKARFRFYTTDGSFLDTLIPGVAIDSGDKAIYKAITMSLKYALTTTFCIPFAEMHDGDKDGPTPERMAENPDGGNTDPAMEETRVLSEIQAAVNNGSIKQLAKLYNSMGPTDQEKYKDRLANARQEINSNATEKGGGK